MGILAAGLASLLAAVLVLAVPLAGRQRYRRLLDAVERDPGARLRYYQRGIEREWLAVALVGVIGLLAHRGPDVIGLTTGPHPAAVFGLDHLCQGARGVILTGLVGAVLGSVVTSTGSLLPAMAVHALVDLRVLALPDLSSPDEPAPTRRPGVRIEP